MKVLDTVDGNAVRSFAEKSLSKSSEVRTARIYTGGQSCSRKNTLRKR
jgi:hypothetical protein